MNFLADNLQRSSKKNTRAGASLNMVQFIRKYGLRYMLPLSIFFLLVLKPCSSAFGKSLQQTVYKYSASVVLDDDGQDDGLIFEDIDDQDTELEKGASNPAKFIKYVSKFGIDVAPFYYETISIGSKSYRYLLPCQFGKRATPLRL